MRGMVRGSCVAMFAVMSLTAASALAGVGSSGGGKSVVCRESSGRIVRAQLLDLFEAAHRDGLKLKAPLGDMDREYTALIRELRRVTDDSRPVSREELAYFRSSLSQSFNFTPVGVRLEDLADTGPVSKLPFGCALEQLAIYRDKIDRIDVDGEIWNALDSQNRVALYAHEIFWHDYRVLGDKTSVNARKIAASFFTTTPPAREKDGVPASAPEYWGTQKSVGQGTTLFYAYADAAASGSTVLQFNRLVGRDTYSPVRVTLPVARLELKMEADGMIVTDPAANLRSTFAIRGGVFAGYRLGIIYSFNEPMTVSLVDPSGKLVDRDIVTVMFAAGKR